MTELHVVADKKTSLLDLADECERSERRQGVQRLREAYTILFGEDNHDIWRAFNRFIESMALTDAALGLMPPGCVEMSDWHHLKGDPPEKVVHEVWVQRIENAETLGYAEALSRPLAYVAAAARAHAELLDEKGSDD